MARYAGEEGGFGRIAASPIGGGAPNSPARAKSPIDPFLDWLLGSGRDERFARQDRAISGLGESLTKRRPMTAAERGDLSDLTLDWGSVAAPIRTYGGAIGSHILPEVTVATGKADVLDFARKLLQPAPAGDAPFVDYIRAAIDRGALDSLAIANTGYLSDGLLSLGRLGNKVRGWGRFGDEVWQRGPGYFDVASGVYHPQYSRAMVLSDQGMAARGNVPPDIHTAQTTAHELTHAFESGAQKFDLTSLARAEQALRGIISEIDPRWLNDAANFRVPGWQAVQSPVELLTELGRRRIGGWDWQVPGYTYIRGQTPTLAQTQQTITPYLDTIMNRWK